MKRILATICFSAMCAGCATFAKPVPVLQPTVATAVTQGLADIQQFLASQPGVPVGVTAALTDAQNAIAADITGTTWGAEIRVALSTIYSQLPASVLSNPIFVALYMGAEAALATIGA